MSSAILQARGLCIGYAPRRRPRLEVASDLEVELFEGELVCLLGPNGAGKSTLVRTLSGLQKPLSGEVLLQGGDLHALTESERARLLGIVLTERVDAGNLSACSLAGLGRYPYTGWDGRLSPADEEVVRWAMAAVGAGDLAARSVGELSDGERQKVMIARALAQEPAVLLLDEPTAFLDLPRRVEILQLLRRLAAGGDRAVLLSTHDLDLALRCADRLWLLPPGGPLQTGAPEDLVLSGAFQRTFADVEFNPVTGSFQLEQEPEGVVGLEGEGLYALWTARALERAGFRVDSSGNAEVRVEIVHQEGGTAWRLRTASAPRLCTTLYEMVGCVRHLLAESSKPPRERRGTP